MRGIAALGDARGGAVDAPADHVAARRSEPAAGGGDRARRSCSDPAAIELLIDLVSAQWPSVRAAALNALARTDADTFISAISGLDPDAHWSVRAALATALGELGASGRRRR